MRSRLATWSAVGMLLALGIAMGAERPQAPQQRPRAAPVASPPAAIDSGAFVPSGWDLFFEARVRARELRFDATPRASFRFSGDPANDTLLVTRHNLPRPIRPGVTYRDIEVHFTAATRFTGSSGAAPALIRPWSDPALPRRPPRPSER